MSVANEIFEGITHAPDTVQNPLVAAVAGGATVLALGGVAWSHKHSQDKRVQVFPNPAGDKAVRNTRGGELSTRTSRIRRIGPVLGAVVGLGLIGGWRAHPMYDNPHSDAGASEVAVIDASYSMLRTTDMGDGVTRYDAVRHSLIDNKTYRGRMGIVVTAEGNKVAVPSSRDYRDNLEVLKDPKVDPNGKDLAGAIEKAGRQLPLKTTKDGSEIRKGKVIIVSDGVGADSGSAADISRAISNLKANGASVEAIVPGKSGSTYRTDGSEIYSSGPKSGVFDALDQGEVMRASNAGEVASDIDKAIAEGSTVNEQEPWRIPLDAGIGLLAVSALYGGYRSIRRY